MKEACRLFIFVAVLASAGRSTGAAPAPVPVPATRTVLILLYEDVEAADFGVPFEVFNVASEQAGYPAFKVLLGAEGPGPVSAHAGLRVMPDCTFADCPQPDVLVIPGGPGIFKLMQKPAALEFVQQRAARADLVVGLCIGSMLLAKAGLLDGLTVTTHPLGIDYLTQLAPRAKVVKNQRFVDAGKVVTSSGMVPGIEMSLHLVSRLLGEDKARATATYLEYPWTPGI
jgi:transcriptional regulator GlxA family with amidase domain